MTGPWLVMASTEYRCDGSVRPGHATLDVRSVDGASAATAVRSASPLKLLVPRSRGSSVWAFTSSFGGGLVAGDQTRLDVSLDAGTCCFLGSQSSTKIYRNPAGRPCSHETNVQIGAGGLLVLAPDPIQLFADASFSQRQSFRLEPGASLVLLDWFTAGRVARAERWQFKHYQTWNEVIETSPQGQTSKPLFIDSLRLNPEDGALDGLYRTGRFNCFATLLMIGPGVAALATSAVASLSARPVVREASLLASASALPNGAGAVLRMAGDDLESVAGELGQFLRPLIPVLGDDPWARKW